MWLIQIPLRSIIRRAGGRGRVLQFSKSLFRCYKYTCEVIIT